MTLKPRPLTSSTKLHGINMLVHADGGAGKTVLAGTSDRCLFLEADDGSDSAAAAGSKAQALDISGWDSMDEAFDYVKYDVPRMPEPKRFQWVWLDGITLFFDLGLHTFMEELVAAKAHRKLWAPDRGEYGQNMNRLKLLVRNFAALPINFGITAHSYINEDDGRQWPLITGKGMPNYVCGHMQIVGHLMVKSTPEGKPIRVLYTNMTDDRYAKDRFEAIGEKMLNPTIPKVQAKIEAKLASLAPKRRLTPKPATNETIGGDEEVF